MPPEFETTETKAPASPWHGAGAGLLSLAAHLSAFILAALLIRERPPAAIEEGDRAATIVLASRSPAKTEYFADAATASAERHEVLRPAVETAGAGGSALPSPEPPPAIEGLALPQLPGALPPGEGLVVAAEANERGRGRVLPQGIDDAAILAEDALIPREHVPTGPTAQLSLFGSAQAEGRSFVFVIDRSKSMGGDGLGAIQAAAAELEAQIGSLTEEQTFQVVAYNQSAAFLGERKLLAASDANKERLIDFVKNLAAYGQTEHYHALLAALRLKPEVIFLLTDGGEPELDPGQLRAIRDEAGGRTSIHCLHFGSGPLGGKSNDFLTRLAAQNRGSYVYIDMDGR